MNNEQVIDVTPESPKDRRRGLTGGLALIILGVVFLGQSLGWPVPQNWWALFILLPVLPNLLRAASLLRDGDGLGAIRSLGSSMVLCLVAVVFLLNLNWERVWPAFLIFAGVSMLLPRRDRAQR